MKILTKRQKEIETSRQIRKFLKETIEPKLFNDLKKELEDENLPEKYMVQEDYTLLKKIIDKNFKL